jgi:putative effector of murein hydrolase
MPQPSDPRKSFTDWRQRNLLRANLLVLLSLIVAFWLSQFPHNHPSPWLVFPLLLAMIGTADTLRCMQTRWNWYHGGVVLCAYMDLMAVCLILFFLVYPLWL